MDSTSDIHGLARFVDDHRRLFVLTGAGVSTGSGIPDYRDGDGGWKRKPPVRYGEFVRDESVRRRYWARSLLGWPRIARARPGRSHAALARLEESGRLHRLVTQNVDGLHQSAGSRSVIDLHGRLDSVECLSCRRRRSRFDMQTELEESNPRFRDLESGIAPDGDADLETIDFDAFRVPDCDRCGGILKPSVVFFGESVPRSTVERAFDALRESDAMLVVGSSLMVWSGYRFCRAAAEQGKPIAAINLGRTRADDHLDLKIVRDCGEVLSVLLERLSRRGPAPGRGVDVRPTRHGPAGAPTRRRGGRGFAAR